ncbi:MAG TPA: hypothetical protein VGX37_05160 [Allosphingosinicella sp.]|jgi:hypothetical protein|nr:hypothetical protein [Allosphingosinicella sp.]
MTTNRPTILNRILETFVQTPNFSCVGCHNGETTATPPQGAADSFAAAVGFLVMHARPAT